MRAIALLALLAPALLACGEPPCDLPSAPALGTGTTTLDGETAVIGFADLHTHPGIDRAFDRRLVWGDACQPVDALDGNVLPAIDPCPVETHRAHTSDPLERTAHGLVLPMLNAPASYPHAPVGDRQGPHLDAWPNGRDVIHQGMHVSSIRRAYEGGQRILFASVTDSQVLAQLLQGPMMPELFRARLEYEEQAARAELHRIREIAEDQREWMEVAYSAEDARRIVTEGKLAIILSLEMDALAPGAIARFVREGVRHVVVVHLVDNTYGGTAVTGDVFNASSAYLSELWSPDDRYRFIDVARSEDVLSTLERPILGMSGPGDLPVYAQLTPIPLAWYRGLAYSDTCYCDLGFTGQTSFRALGHLNRRALTPEGEALIRSLLEGIDVDGPGVEPPVRVMVDLSHMSHATADAAIGVACDVGAPLMASHGGIGRAGVPMGAERALSSSAAAWIARSGGVIGLGTAGDVAAQLVLRAGGGPVATLAPIARHATARPFACIARGAADPACSASAPAQPLPAIADAASVTTLSVRIAGGAALCDPSVARVGYVEVASSPAGECGSVAPSITRARLVADAGGCRADVVMPTAAADGIDQCSPDAPGSIAWGRVCNVGLHWVDAADCRMTDADTGTAAEIASIELLAEVAGGTTETVLSLARTDGRAWTRLAYDRADVTLYDRAPAPAGIRRSVRVGATMGPGGLPGAALTSTGFDVCVRVRACRGMPCACEPVAASPESAACDPGWRSLNLAGAWPAGARLDAYLHLPADVAPSDVCGVDLQLIGDGAIHPIAIDDVRVESMRDPLMTWAEDYGSALDTFFAGEPGRIAFGTDVNGLQTQMPFTESSPASFTNGAFGWSARPLTQATIAGTPLRLEDRGLATYGMLADLVATLAAVNELPPAERTRINESILLSAEQVIRYWERLEGTRTTGSDTSCP